MKERQTEKTKLRFQGRKQRRVYVLTEIALMSAVFCVLAPIAMPVPFSPVPITFGTFVLYLTAALSGARKGTVSVGIYLLTGLAGLPVFSGFTAGFTKLLGPGGGYMIGYLPAVFVMGLLAEKVLSRTAERGSGVWQTVKMAGVFTIGAVVCYFFGTVWFLTVMDGYTVSQALLVCVVPFLPFEAVKVILASVAAPLVRKKLKRAGIWTSEDYL